MEQEALISRIQNSINKSGKEPAFIPFVEVGYPNIEFSKKLCYLFQEKNAAAIEIGVPFSDPLADGPVIQRAAKKALDNGVTLKKTFEFLEEIKKDIKTPLILFSYFNPILSLGIDNFIEELKRTNVAGVIIPDLPLEESDIISEKCKSNNIDFIMLIAPTSDDKRIKAISQKSAGFIYLVSSTGVTGVREDFSDSLATIIGKIKSYTSTPIAIGFGVSKPEHIQQFKELNADGVIIASAFIKLIEQYQDNQEKALKKLSLYIDTLYN